ncbi:MAG TPA: tetratricopeptide repeat protein [Xanthobacteraceae bacterium]|jgi:predicted O-linked N-acetylglucosamine transferase (SPINDLY family)|nr:tetratricopeptide repeat protein [Xanthobacteraceae bacterium]
MTDDRNSRIQAALVLQKAGRFGEAAAALQHILTQTPNDFDCLYLLATLQGQQGNLDAAITLFRQASKIRPDIPDVQYNLAVALGMAGRHADAAKIYKRLLEAYPRHPHARNNYATSLMSEGKFADALRQYDELLAFYPELADAHNNRGMALQALKRLDEALTSFDRAITQRPSFAQAYVNRGNTLALLLRSDEALKSFKSATALQPDLADSHVNAGNIHLLRRSYNEAIAAYDRGLALADSADARSMRLFAKMHLCDWADFDTERAALLASIARDEPAYPFITLALSSSPAEQLQCARNFNRSHFPIASRPLWRGERYRHDKLRVGYVSSDFREHAVSQLVMGMFECHDKSRFETTAISLGPDDGSDSRERLERAFDRFIDAAALRDDEIARRIREAEIDILVDLNGYTQGARMGIFAQRAAPAQVSYLGYSGTSGADYFDYIVADRVLIPAEHSAFYSEKIIWLPDCFMAHDNTRPISDQMPTRTELQLPESGFVFCCFNQPYKVNPAIFDIWMRLLQAIEGSVLWLKAGDSTSVGNLRREAERRGVRTDRLVFAPSVPSSADHLARHRQADLFLDTQPYNAHATTGDALWAGLPVLTGLGSTFASRVAASELYAVGLAELVTTSLEEYEALALKLACDPALLAIMKTKLASRASTRLFDTARFTRHIEVAYRTMWQLLQRGAAPASFAVEDLG